MRRLLYGFFYRFVGLALTAFALIHAPTAAVAAASIFGLTGDRLYNFDVASGQATGRVNLVNEAGTPLYSLTDIAFLPVAEPAPMTVLATALAGLIAVRLRNRHPMASHV